ncbi:hypothetical protein RN001_015497 [Aquatica leii]|uniref:Protease inhibitor n=1 Tax=Aquatica leii TaxID=1421715 RepID=A0AAN7QCM7_9COLE|nr:hypothetical protein RN001_015497 [Aquatica leii]
MYTTTMRTAFVLLILSVLIVTGKSAPTFELFECRSGQEFISNECNQCYCLNNGELVCQIQECVNKKFKNLENCRTGTVWRNNCNKCWCINSGTICTNNRCF